VSRRLPREFYSRAAEQVAPDLLGRIIAARVPTGVLRARLVEVEAYGPADPASHSFGGKTRRNASMFGPPGHLYVYLSYGVHHCMNLVTGPEGEGSAVLLRAAEPLDGLDEMRLRRGGAADRDLCRGPGRLAQALGVDLSRDGADVVSGEEVWIEDGPGIPPGAVARTPRVGVTRGAGDLWRFVEAGSSWLSRPAP
jgi:DNA-3-methyladenine glycosylase